MKKLWVGALLLLFILPARAQRPDKAAYFWVTFTDKDQSLYRTEAPEAFLCRRAIERRERHGIAISAQDFPVNAWYVDSLRRRGAAVHHTSRWFNAVTVKMTPRTVDTLRALPFVDSIAYVGPVLSSVTRKGGGAILPDTAGYEGLPDRPYGYASLQIAMLRGIGLHASGYTGKGKMIGVLDGGFYNVDVMPFFDSLRLRNGILATRDFVEGDSIAYEGSTHGTQVLSTMAAYLPNLLVGTAPGADYLLIKTEDTKGEYRIEECNWIAGVEYADSAGVDIINSSLGYTTFNDSTMNYDFQALNGRTGMASRAANLAFDKGMIVVSSAGNEGNSVWRHIGVPSDAAGALAVGATDFRGEKASFSSIGPAADGRIKPDIAGPGQFVAVASPDSYQVMVASGTSFSAPIITGLIAALWEAFPERSNREIREAVIRSAHQYDAPDAELGYGIPNFERAYAILAEAPASDAPVKDKE